MNAGWVGRHRAAAFCGFIGRLQQSRYIATSWHMRQSKTQIRLRIRASKVTSRHMRQSKTQITLHICASKVTSRHMRQSKTQIRQRIRAAKVTSRHMRQSKTQIKLRICAAKVTSRHMHPLKIQTAHSRSKSYKSALCAIRRLIRLRIRSSKINKTA